MREYSIKDLENYTNIKAHTIRVWEQRYNILNPIRTSTNIRKYNERDLKHLLNVNLLYKKGLKISKIAKLTETELKTKVVKFFDSEKFDYKDVVDQFIKYVIELDSKKCNRLLLNFHQEIGLEKNYEKVIIPLLQRIGYLWQVDTLTIQQEHFIFNIIRSYIIKHIEGINNESKNRGTVLLFLCEHERHELTLLFYNYVLKKKGFECINLGDSLPLSNIISSIQTIQPIYVFTCFIVDVSDDILNKVFRELIKVIDANQIFVGGNQVVKNSNLIPSKVNKIRSLRDIELL